MRKNVLGNDPFIRSAPPVTVNKGEAPKPKIPSRHPVRKPKPSGAAHAPVQAERKQEADRKQEAVPAQPPAPQSAPPSVLVPRASTPLSLLDQLTAFLKTSKNLLARMAAGGGTTSLSAGLYSALHAALDGSAGHARDRYGKDPELVQQLAPLWEFLYRDYWRVEVQGAESIPAGPLIIVANQAGAVPWGGIVLPLALQRSRPDLGETRWLAEPALLRTPVFGALLNRLGAVLASPDNALQLLEGGHQVLVFPEGLHGMRKRFSERHHLRQFGRGGFVKLALRAGASIVPAGCVGGAECSPLWVKLPTEFGGLPFLPVTTPPLPARWRVKFGSPLPADSFEVRAEDDLAGIERLVERVRAAVAAQLEALLADGVIAFE